MALGGQPLTSCGDSRLEALPEPFWDNEDYRLATDVEGPICGGTLDFQAGFVDRLQDVFGQPRDDRRFTYYALSDEFFARGLCGGVGGCYADGILLSPVLLNLHELVHAVLGLAQGPTHRFVSEGIAEVFRDRYGGALPIPPDLSLQEAIAGAWSDPEQKANLYARSGHFLAYVMDVHGVPAALDLYRLADPKTSEDVLRPAIEAATGLTMEELAADYATYPECTNYEYRWPIMECSLSPTEWHGCAWQVHASVDCGSADVIGPRAGGMWTVRVLDVPVEGDYQVTTFGDPAEIAYVEIGGCAVGCAPGKYLTIALGRTVVAHLSAGPHYVSLVRGQDRPGLSGVRIEAAGDAETPGCVP